MKAEIHTAAERIRTKTALQELSSWLRDATDRKRAYVAGSKAGFDPAQSRDGNGRWSGGGGSGRGGNTGAFRIPKNPLLGNVNISDNEAIPPKDPLTSNLEGGNFARGGGAPQEQAYLSQARNLPHGVVTTGNGVTNLSSTQSASLKKFQGKGNGFKNVKVTNFSDGRAIFSARIPAKKIPGSYAIWEKHVDVNGKTIKTNKIVVGPEGELIHIKHK